MTEHCFYCLSEMKDGECGCKPFNECEECGKSIPKSKQYCTACSICLSCVYYGSVNNCMGDDGENCSL